jgi:transcriptional regulator NrdR family protein
MNCPKCGAENMSRVMNVRSRGDQGTYRRRECTICGCRFSSMEVVVEIEHDEAKRRRRRRKTKHGEND